jgi:hypothetical protein
MPPAGDIIRRAEPPVPGPPAGDAGRTYRECRRTTTTKGTAMGFLGKAIKSGVAIKAANMLMREAQKPENQRKARELMAKAKNRKR